MKFSFHIQITTKTYLTAGTQIIFKKGSINTSVDA